MLGDLLDVEGRPAAAAHRPAARPEDVDAHGQAAFARRLEDRPIAPLAEQLAGAAQEQHMRKAAIAGAPADLLHGELAVLIGNDDGRLEPRLAGVPPGPLVLVGGKRFSAAELVVLLALPGRREGV